MLVRYINKNGKIVSYNKETTYKYPVMIGDVFNGLTIEGFLLEDRRLHCQCRCTCGQLNTATPYELYKAIVKSCGCLKKKIGTMNLKHGLSRHYLYRIWRRIKQSCLNSKSQDYKYYGARGIKIFAAWNDFDNFFEYIINTIGERPDEKHSLDRINNNGDYAPNNLRWATKKEQVENRRLVHIDKIVEAFQNLRNNGVADQEIINMAINDLYGLLKR